MRILSIAIAFLWCGLVLGISFIEAPLKFQAPGITLGLGLGIGRLVFGVLNIVELALAVVMLVLLIATRPVGRYAKLFFAVIAGILLIETLWLLPALDVRAQAVIAGTAAPYSGMHIVYIVCDSVKVVLLFALGWSLARSALRNSL